MKSVFILLDHSHLDLLLVPVIEQLIKRNINVIPCVCDAGKSDLLESKKIPYTKNFLDFSEFANRTGSRLFLNAADMNYPAHEKGRMADELCRECGIPSLTMEHAVNPLYFDRVSENSMFNADRIALTGTKSFEMFKAKGCSSQQLVITGSPKFDLYYQLDTTLVINENQQRLNLNSNKPCLLIAGVNHRRTIIGDHTEQKWISVLSSLFAAIRKKFPNFDILIKPHPAS